MIRDVTLAELVEAMAHVNDDETFRWFQTSILNARGEPQPTDTLRVSMGQAREELKPPCYARQPDGRR